LCFLFGGEISLPFPSYSWSLFVVGMTACGIELLDNPGKANVASVQQIAFRDLKRLR
jgi:hypothetical protein